MTAFKVTTNIQNTTEEDRMIIQQAHRISNEVMKLRSEIVGEATPIECVCESVEEFTMLKEFRASKYNYRMERIKVLQKRFTKTFH